MGERGEGGGRGRGGRTMSMQTSPLSSHKYFLSIFCTVYTEGRPWSAAPRSGPPPSTVPLPSAAPPAVVRPLLVGMRIGRTLHLPPTHQNFAFFCMNSSVIWRREREMTLLKVRTIRKRLVRNFILWTVLLGLKFEQLKIYTAYLQV